MYLYDICVYIILYHKYCKDADAHVLPADSFMSLEPPTVALDGLPSRLRTVEMRAGISGGLELRHLRAGSQQAPTFLTMWYTNANQLKSHYIMEVFNVFRLFG